jgi:hypothetical protein
MMEHSTNSGTCCTSPEDLSREVANTVGLRERFGSLASHPYNKDDPERSVWWLFPKSRAAYANWPAYDVAKFMFRRRRGEPKLWAGLHVEKGLGLAEAKAFGSGKAKHFAMTPEWAWHGFLDDLENGLVRGALSRIADRADLPVEVSVSVGHPLGEPKIFEAYSDYGFVYIPADGSLDCANLQLSKANVPGLDSVKSLDALGQGLRKATVENPFTWMNLTVGCWLEMIAASDGGTSWKASDVWARVLEPLARWVE